MKEYRYIKDALSEFSSNHGFSLEEYHESFRGVIEASPVYREALKSEIQAACRDLGWSWVNEAERADFIGVDVCEDSTWMSVIALIWQAIAPNEEPPKNVTKVNKKKRAEKGAE
ncbi:hypothetical protein [Parendozoicomonas sp. Alg238-R29]|uniref:hypothetical protein n=1 Tax=Parendozoicomonas sp. Alg238-R29 TaxID=2993446 RepID=UPI00248EC1AC|nr:hypothetical protein [Parendozoicomonas sp. Alg238-R29]